jgi:hypothetical protein
MVMLSSAANAWVYMLDVNAALPKLGLNQVCL